MNRVRWAAVLSWVNAAGFGLPVLPVIRHLRARGDLPAVLGFRAFGGGPFEGLGPAAFRRLLLAFLLVCTGEAVAGLLLWRGRRSGGLLSIALLPLGAIFWVGFALPFTPLNALARTAVILRQWRRLDPCGSRRPGADRRDPGRGLRTAPDRCRSSGSRHADRMLPVARTDRAVSHRVGSNRCVDRWKRPTLRCPEDVRAPEASEEGSQCCPRLRGQSAAHGRAHRRRPRVGADHLRLWRVGVGVVDAEKLHGRQLRRLG